MIYKGVLCILLSRFCLSSIHSYNSQPIPYVIVCRGSLSIKPYTSPIYSYIMSLRDVVINTRYMFTLMPIRDRMVVGFTTAYAISAYHH